MRQLTIELVPSPCWYSNMRTKMSRAAWDKIRRQVYAEYHQRCGICQAEQVKLHCHEIWQYDDAQHIQKLQGFIALCEMCHHVKHIGMAGILASEGKLDFAQVVEHFIRVNQCSHAEYEAHSQEAWERWKERNQHQWTTDLGTYAPSVNEGPMPTLEKMIAEVNTFRSVAQYCTWLARLSNADFAVWAAWPTATYYLSGAIEEEQRKRRPPEESDRKKPSLGQGDTGEGSWIYARRQQGEYPEYTELSGKWMVFPHVTEVDRVWFSIAEAVEQGKLGRAAKVATCPGRLGDKEDDRVICVYTYNSEDKQDILRILQQLRALGIHHRAFYKEDSETHEGNYAGVNIISRQPTTRSPVKYYANPGQVELLVPKSRS